MGAKLWALGLALAALAASAAAQPAPAPVPEQTDPHICEGYFSRKHEGMQDCSEALQRTNGSSYCPPVCRGLFDDMPLVCAAFVSQSLEAQQAGSLNVQQQFDVCRMLSLPLNILRGLNLLQIEALAQQWVRQTDGDNSSSSWNGAKVAVIVVSVVAANLVILGAVALFIWLRRRRRTQQLGAPGMHPAAITTVVGGGSAMVPAPSTDTPSSQDAKEDLKLEHLDSAERGHVPAAGGTKQGMTIVDIELAVGAGGRPRLSAIPSASGGSGGHPSGISSGGTGSGGTGSSGTGSGGSAGMVAAARGMMVAGQVSQDGVQGVAALWAAAAAQGAAAGWPPGMQPASHPVVGPPGTATRSTASPTLSAAATDHMQMDEQEMMRLGSHGAVFATGAPHGTPSRQVAGDPLLTWLNTMQRHSSGASGSVDQQAVLSPPAGGSGSSAELAGGSSREGTVGIGSPDMTGRSASGEPLLGQQRRPSDMRLQGSALTPFGNSQLQASGLPSRNGSSRALGGDAPRLNSGLVDLTPWLIDYHELDIQRPLGEGSFGKVYLAKWRETLVAVKLLVSSEDGSSTMGAGAGGAGSGSGSTFSLSSPGIETLQKEAGLMAAMRHPNICYFLGVCTSPPAVVTEFCSRGSLLDVIRTARGSEQAASSLTWVRRLSMALDAAKGMLCLHAHAPPILHRDLKSPNLLVDAAWRVKVCDFNLSKLLEASTTTSSTGGAMNPRWLAPEILMGQSATTASDVFSFGVVLHELLTWQLPWEGANLYQLVFTVSQGQRLPIPTRDQLPGPDQLGEYDAYVALIQRCWAQRPEDRPAFADVITELRAILSKTLSASANSRAAAFVASA